MTTYANVHITSSLLSETGATGAETTTTTTHAEHKNNFFYGDINEVIWGSVAFGIIAVLFVWKGLAPLKRAMANRSQRIADQIARAEAANAAATGELDALRAQLGNAAEESARIVADARDRSALVRADLIARADADVNESKTRARIEIEASKTQALADLREEVVAMTVRATEAVVAENLTDAVKADLVDRYIQQVGVSR